MRLHMQFQNDYYEVLEQAKRNSSTLALGLLVSYIFKQNEIFSQT